MTEINNNEICRYENKAEEILDGKGSESMLKKIMDIFEKVPVLRRLAKQGNEMVSMLKNYKSGEYKRVPYETIFKISLALAYVISPIDLIPDTVPVVGYIDDVAVMEFVGKSIEDDVEKYKEWKEGKI